MIRPRTLLSACALFAALGPATAAGEEALFEPFTYDYRTEAAVAAEIDVDHPDPARLREIFAKRRARVIEAIPSGAMLIFSVERAQERRLEFQVPHSDNHDFIYLTGLDGIDSLDSAILLLPAHADAPGRLDEAPRDRVALYTSRDPEVISRRTGIADVRPFAKLEQDLSVAMTDFRDWRVTQVRRYPLAAALSRAWGGSGKVLYLNYPRFFRLGMPEPVRLETFERIRRFSPDVVLRDAADIMDQVRMLQDSWSLANLRRAVEITGEGVIEALRSARAGMTEKQVMEVMDFVYRYRGATLGFPTSVRREAAEEAQAEESVPEGWIEFVPRSGGAVIQAGDMVWTDTGAAFNHYSADIQRAIPVDGTFTAEQRRLYEIALDVQTTVIEMVRPGVTWWELHDKAIEMLRDAGGYDVDYYYGIGHFIGMEVHDEGDYLVPLQPGMVLSIEQGVMKPGEPRIAFEDDVLVTEDGYEWLSRSIPIEIDEVESMLETAGALSAFVESRAEPADLAKPIEVHTTASDGTIVVGDHYRPAAPAASTVLLFHQAGGDARGEYGAIVERLLAEGFEVFAWDARGGGDRFGGSNRTVARLEHEPEGYCEAYPDLEAALEHAFRYGSGGPIYAVGSSYSAALVIRLAAEHGPRLAGVAAFSPAGARMGDCAVEIWLPEVESVAIAPFRPASEMTVESVAAQAELFAAHGVELFVADGGVHGASMLDPSRAKGPTEATWERFLGLLRGSGGG